jgi:SNF2 family DNA or RNA helicase
VQETARGADAARNAAVKSAAGASLELQEQPAFLSAGKLRQYQLEGLNWLTYAWLKVTVLQPCWPAL